MSDYAAVTESNKNCFHSWIGYMSCSMLVHWISYMFISRLC